MFGALYGDIAGSPYEFGNFKAKKFILFRDPRQRHPCRCTDDSVMTVAVMDALLNYGRSDSLDHFRELLIESMRKFGRLYPRAGYGGKFARWIYSSTPKPYYSFGNGSAMRVSPVAWYAETLSETLQLAEASADVTHNHPEGIKGAVATAGSVFLARTGTSKEEIRAFASRYYDLNFTIDEIREDYDWDVTCQGSVPQAIVSFLEGTSLDDTARNAISLGGDSDTIAAMACSIAGAFYGVGDDDRKTVLSYLDKPLLDTVLHFEALYGEEK